MGFNFIKKYKILIISKNCQNCIEIKFEIENVDSVRKTLRSGRMEGWMDGWMGGWESRVKDCLQQSINYNGSSFSKVVRFLKYKFLIILKLNFNEGQLKKILNSGYFIKLYILQLNKV